MSSRPVLFFEQLLGLLQTAGLEEALGGPGPFTIFAPTNNAVTMMDEDVTAVLRSPDGLQQLQETLKYHVVPGIILSDDVSPGQMFETLNGCMLTLSQEGQSFFINDAQILDADILASNGVIHVINSVLLPAADCETVAPAPSPTEPPTSAPTDPLTDAPDAAPVQPTVEPAPQNATDPEPEIPMETEQESADGASNLSEAPVEEPAPPETPIKEDEGATSGSPVRTVALTAIFSSILPFLLLA